MTVPGIGALSALAFVSTIEDPASFSRSRSVGAHLGLTPRRYQSGEIDRSGRISGCGDVLVRTLIYEAAIVILHRVKRALHLKDWALAIAERAGPGKARVALARKLTVILHSVWRSGEPFRWEPVVFAACGAPTMPRARPVIVIEQSRDANKRCSVESATITPARLICGGPTLLSYLGTWLPKRESWTQHSLSPAKAARGGSSTRRHQSQV